LIHFKEMLAAALGGTPASGAMSHYNKTVAFRLIAGLGLLVVFGAFILLTRAKKK